MYSSSSREIALNSLFRNVIHSIEWNIHKNIYYFSCYVLAEQYVCVQRAVHSRLNILLVFEFNTHKKENSNKEFYSLHQLDACRLKI